MALPAEPAPRRTPPKPKKKDPSLGLCLWQESKLSGTDNTCLGAVCGMVHAACFVLRNGTQPPSKHSTVRKKGVRAIPGNDALHKQEVKNFPLWPAFLVKRHLDQRPMREICPILVEACIRKLAVDPRPAVSQVDVSNFRDTIPTMSSTPPPTPEVATTYTFIGCFEDNTQNRALSGMSVKGDSGMTTEVSVAAATVGGSVCGYENFEVPRGRSRGRVSALSICSLDVFRPFRFCSMHHHRHRVDFARCPNMKKRRAQLCAELSTH